MKAIEKMQKATSDEDVRAILEYREKAVRDEADRMSYATKKASMRGKEEGIMIGEQKGKELECITIALQMLSLSISIETISAATGLSKANILKLKQ